MYEHTYIRTNLSSQLYSPYSVIATVSDVQYTVNIYGYSHRSTDWIGIFVRIKEVVGMEEEEVCRKKIMGGGERGEKKRRRK